MNTDRIAAALAMALAAGALALSIAAEAGRPAPRGTPAPEPACAAERTQQQTGAGGSATETQAGPDARGAPTIRGTLPAEPAGAEAVITLSGKDAAAPQDPGTLPACAQTTKATKTRSNIQNN